MDWHPDAKRVPFSDAGSFVSGTGHKLVWHTTETRSLPGYDGTQPHFTLNPRTGDLWQHQPLSHAAKALMHPAGTVETNRAHAYQVELVCYSDVAVARRVGGLAVDDLTDADYARIARLARWIEKNAGVPRRSSVRFVHYPQASYPRFSDRGWLAYGGHCGHQHVPHNLHGDPSALKIDKILDLQPPWKLVKGGKVFARGSFKEMRLWLRHHAAKVKRLKGINLRPR